MGASMTQPDFEGALARIRTRFLDRLGEQSAELRQLLERAESGADRRDSIKAFGAIAHKIAGLAKSVGFAELGQAALEADQAIIRWLGDEEPKPTDSDVLWIMQNCLARCEDTLSDNQR